MSDRIQHGFEQIEPALAAGKTVICDRYVYTSLANMLARGYAKERWFFESGKYLIEPDLALLAFADPLKAIERIKARPEEAKRHLNEGLLKAVAANFLAMKKTYGFVQLDTAGDAEAPFSVIVRELERMFGFKEQAA
jgi:dTMP kinase